ncbi:MAG: response regulator transcription factor [Hyphomicrobiales bacterium]|nr:response regulator transcription factor [Hyphomicrobiales bacterium]MCP5372027.1 response regulator transcription factor [Hyphomicrobiales bacterium]
MAIAKREPCTVVIADDHDIVRAGLRAALEAPGVVEDQGLRVVAEAENGFDTLAAVKEHQPDLLLLDLTMPLAGGAEVLTDLRRWSPRTKVVVFSSVTAGGTLCQMVEAGVDGMFAKGGSSRLLYEKLPLILRGGRFIAPECLALIEEAPAAAVGLTPRERQTLHMILGGRTTKEMARAQGISPRTAEKHRASLMAKLEVRSVAELMARALRDGLLDGLAEATGDGPGTGANG